MVGRAAGLADGPVPRTAEPRARPDGSPLGGTLWHRTEFQVGIQLHGITEALLVIEETPAASRPPHGLVTATLSLYGADDALVAEVERRWSTWWGARRA